MQKELASMKNQVEATYGGRVRLRACGVLRQDDDILVLKHNGVGPQGYLWAPPGGGVELGETLEACVCREFMEETGLEVEVLRFICINQYIGLPIHTVEAHFEVRVIGGALKQAQDIIGTDNGILNGMAWVDPASIIADDMDYFHQIFHAAQTADEIMNLPLVLTSIKPLGE